MQEISSVQFSRSIMSDSLQPHGPQHARPPCPSPIPGVYSDSCPLSQRYHPTISSSVIPFSSRFQSFPASGSFPMSQLFASGGQSIEVSASGSVLPMNILDWFPLGWTGWISLQEINLVTKLMVTRGERGRDKLEIWDWQIHNTVYKIDNQQGPTVQHRELYLISCNNV